MVAELLCAGGTRPYDQEITRAMRFYGLEAKYPLILDYTVHALEEHEFASAPRSAPYEVGGIVFWRKEQAGEAESMECRGHRASPGTQLPHLPESASHG